MKVCFIALFAFFSCLEAHAGAYDQYIASGVKWLITPQTTPAVLGPNADGSWGASPDV